jgi:hypothetical protein
MSTWAIDDSEGNGICEGLQSERQARKLARGKANARGKSFFIYESGSDSSEEIAPEGDE